MQVPGEREQYGGHILNDEHEGKGGSYLIDANGVKTLVHRTDEAATEPVKPAKNIKGEK